MEQLLALNKSDIIIIFNDELLTFLSELLKIFSQVKSNNETTSELLNYKNLIESGISANLETGIEMFAGYIFSEGNDDFCKKIADRDYNYFFKLEESIDKSNKFSKILMLIKNLFIQLNDTNKDSICGYLENLCTLANVYAIKKLK